MRIAVEGADGDFLYCLVCFSALIDRHIPASTRHTIALIVRYDGCDSERVAASSDCFRINKSPNNPSPHVFLLDTFFRDYFQRCLCLGIRHRNKGNFCLNFDFSNVLFQ